MNLKAIVNKRSMIMWFTQSISWDDGEVIHIIIVKQYIIKE